jgi:hypothetical protein
VTYLQSWQMLTQRVVSSSVSGIRGIGRSALRGSITRYWNRVDLTRHVGADSGFLADWAYRYQGSRWATIGSSRLGDTEGYPATDLAHLIDTTALPRASQARHCILSLRSSTLFCGLRPSRDKNAGAKEGGRERISNATQLIKRTRVVLSFGMELVDKIIQMIPSALEDFRQV